MAVTENLVNFSGLIPAHNTNTDVAVAGSLKNAIGHDDLYNIDYCIGVPFSIPDYCDRTNSITFTLEVESKSGHYTAAQDKWQAWISTGKYETIKYGTIVYPTVTANTPQISNFTIPYAETSNSIRSINLVINGSAFDFTKGTTYYIYLWNSYSSTSSKYHCLWHVTNLTAIADYTEQIQVNIFHWLHGFEKGEGTNSNKASYQLATTSFSNYSDSELIFSVEKEIEKPNGVQLRGLSYNTSNGWASFSLPHNAGVQKADIQVQYDYKFIPYTITYNLNPNNGSSSITNNNASTYNVHYGITFNAPSRIGYDFIEWQKDESTITSINPNPATSFADVDTLYSYLNERATGDVIIDAIWEAKSYTYNIKYLSSSGILLNTGKTTPHNFDSTNTIEPIDITYYNKPDNKSIIWDEESKTIDFEYTPIEHIIEYQDENEGYIGTVIYNIENADENKKYSLLTLQDKNGYEFLGWSTVSQSETEYFTSVEIPTDTKPTTTILFAQWKPTIRYYKVEYYLQDTDSSSINYNILKESILKQGLVGDKMDYTEKFYEGFTFFKADFNNGEENIIKEDGTSIVKLYYNRDKYSLILDNINKGNYYYEEEIKIPLKTLPTGHEYILKDPFSGLFEENNELYTKIIMPARSINTSTPTPKLIKYNLVIEYSNGKLSEDGEIQENFKGTYTIEDTIELPFLIGKMLIVKPTFKGWYGTQENKILDTIPTINEPIILKDNPNGERLIGDRTYVAQFSYQIGEQELFGSSKLIYIKKETEKGLTWTLGNLLPNKEV